MLIHLTCHDDGWHALPREVASWWRARAAMGHGDAPATGDFDEAAFRERASIAYARRESDGIVIDL